MPIVTQESVSKAIKELENDGKNPSLRAIRQLLGGGSLSSIHTIKKGIMADVLTIPFETEELLRPLLTVGAQVVKNCIDNASSALRSEINNLRNDIEEISTSLSETEASRTEYMNKVSNLNSQIVNLSAELKLSKDVLESAKLELDTVRSDLTRCKIRDEDYNIAKQEAAEARDRAAKLEGRLEALLAESTKPETQLDSGQSEVQASGHINPPDKKNLK